MGDFFRGMASPLNSSTNYIEAATEYELCHYCYITMNELLNPETDEKLVLCVCIIPV